MFWIFSGCTDVNHEKKISQDNQCLRPYRTEHYLSLLELNDSVSTTESYWPRTQTMFRTLSFAIRVQGFRNCDDIIYSTYCHWRKCNALCSCYIQAPCAWVPTFQATPSTRALGLSGSKQVGVYFKTDSTWRMAFWVFQVPEGAICALTAKLTVPRLR